MSLVAPDASMCGPMWAAMQVVECERYKHGQEAMDSLFGGVGSFRWGTFTGYFFSPIVTLVGANPWATCAKPPLKRRKPFALVIVEPTSIVRISISGSFIRGSI